MRGRYEREEGDSESIGERSGREKKVTRERVRGG